MTQETPLAAAKHLHAQMLKGVTMAAARLREVRGNGDLKRNVASIVTGGLVLITDKVDGRIRFGSPFSKDVLFADEATAKRWNRMSAMKDEHQVQLMTLEDVLLQHIANTAIFLVDIEARIEVLASKEDGL